MTEPSKSQSVQDLLFEELTKAIWRWRVELTLISCVGLVYFVSTRKIGPIWSGVLVGIGVIVLLNLAPIRTWLKSLLGLSNERRRFEAAIRVQESPLATSRPIVKGVHKVASGICLTVKLRSGTAFKELERIAPYLAVHYGAMEVQVRANLQNAAFAYVTITYKDPLSGDEIEWPYLDRSQVSAWDPIPIGINEEGEEVKVSFPGRHFFIGGESGSGKSVSVSVILAWLARDPTVELFVFDGKNIELSVWKPIFRGWVGTDLKEGIELLDRILDIMSDRYRILGDLGIRKLERHHGLGLIYVIIDELPFYVANSDTKSAKEFSIRLRHLISEARAAGIIVTLTAQKPSADTVPSYIRDLVALRLAFRCTTREASDTILTGGWASQNYSATSIAPKDRGVGLFLGDEGIPRRIRGYWLNDESIDIVVRSAQLLRRSYQDPEMS